MKSMSPNITKRSVLMLINKDLPSCGHSAILGVWGGAAGFIMLLADKPMFFPKPGLLRFQGQGYE